MNVIGSSKVPSNWLDLSTQLGEPADETAFEE